MPPIQAVSASLMAKPHYYYYPCDPPSFACICVARLPGLSQFEVRVPSEEKDAVAYFFLLKVIFYLPWLTSFYPFDEYLTLTLSSLLWLLDCICASSFCFLSFCLSLWWRVASRKSAALRQQHQNSQESGRCVCRLAWIE